MLTGLSGAHPLQIECRCPAFSSATTSGNQSVRWLSIKMCTLGMTDAGSQIGIMMLALSTARQRDAAHVRSLYRCRGDVLRI